MVLQAAEHRDQFGRALTRKEMAERLGCSVETINAKLKQMREGKGDVTMVKPSKPKDPLISPTTMGAYVQTVSRQVDANEELLGLVAMVRKMLRACEDYLEDPDDARKYDLAPRAHELTVVYYDLEKQGTGNSLKRVKKRATLQYLIDGKAGLGKKEVEVVNERRADERQLILSASKELRGCLETAADLTQKMIEVRILLLFLNRVTELIENAPKTVSHRTLAALADDNRLRDILNVLRSQDGQSGEEGGG